MTQTARYKNTQEPTATKKRRTILPKQERRQQLIEATIRCIARDGLGSTTMQMVTREAGLSLGIANLHFETKDNLLQETLRFVAEEYHNGQIAIMRDDSATPGERLAKLLDFQFSPGVAQRQKMAVWFAYYGEASARPVYQTIVSAWDRAAAKQLVALFGEIIEDGSYDNANPSELAIGYSALIEGLHLALLVTPRDPSKKRAKAIAKDFLARAFPHHI